MAAFARANGLAFALTDSSCPVGIYRIVPQTLARGELVEACLPDAVAGYGMARAYIASGGCPDGAEPVIKRIGAIAGDHVDLSVERVAVNGVVLPKSSTRSRDSRGRTVASIARGQYKTAPDQVWIFGLNNPRSWDSRYFGPVPRRSVIGAAIPLLTFGHSQRVK